ncbi:Protein furry [Fasciolopsis buskii]|uniref:Protein furry n=1 Tax=Fasciolopsis buskii TaxID=27845 RepID=A0A8E0RZ55_9TREM|nr:Protein furry [Fasciolopsis buski]KAA0194642.1 Protein furry [Fasciolopsis buski]
MTSSCIDVIGGRDNQRPSNNVPVPTNALNKSDKASQSVTESTYTSKSVYSVSSEMRVLAERRDLAIDIIFCQVLLSLLRQLSYHPGHNHLIEMILDQSFRRFKYREDLQPQNSENVNLVADLYAEIVGVLSQSRFALVRSRFTRHLNELRAKESSPNVKPSIVSLIMGMKFFRVKMHPIEDFVNCFTFLQELGQYFLEVKEPEIKHVLSDLFVEILLPVAAVARQEVNIPALKNFVENLYPTSLELANKKKHIPVRLSFIMPPS